MTDTLERTETTEYPQTITAAPVKSRRALKVTLASIGTAVLIAGGSWGGIAYANNVAAQQAHTVAVAQQHQVDAAIPGLTAQTTAIADESDTATADQVVAAEQAREAAAAAALAAQQAYAASVAKVKAQVDSGSCTPDAYDSAGNVTHCTPTNGNGEVCQAYNDANQCTAWGKNS